MRESGEETYVVKHLDRHLDVGGLPSNDDQTLALAACCTSRHTRRHRARLHDLDLARAHVPNFVDLRAALADDASDEVVRNVDLLRLQLRGRRGRGRRRSAVRVVRRWRGAVPGHVGRVHVRRARTCRLRVPRGARGAVGGVIRVRHTFVGLDEDVANVVRRDVDRIRDAASQSRSQTDDAIAIDAKRLADAQSELSITEARTDKLAARRDKLEEQIPELEARLTDLRRSNEQLEAELAPIPVSRIPLATTAPGMSSIWTPTVGRRDSSHSLRTGTSSH